MTEELSAACGATSFVWAQHHSPLRMLASSRNEPLRERHLADLCAGHRVAGVAFAYLRRPGRPAVSVEPVAGGGYRLHGTAPWVTSWGLAHVYLVGAPLPDGRLLFALVEPDTPGLRAAPLALAAMQATGTVALNMDAAPVAESDVVGVLDAAGWHARDDVAGAAPNPSVYGVARAAVALLGASGERGPTEEAAGRAAHALGEELGRIRAEGYRLTDEAAAAARSGTGGLGRLHEARAQAVDLAVRAANAAVAARAGRAMGLDDPAQRLAREATFYSIQAQTRGGREASLRLAAAVSTRQGSGTR